MNQKAHLILNNGLDITADVRLCKYNQATKKCDVTFQGGKTYSYNFTSIEWVRDPESINPALVHIAHGGRELFASVLCGWQFTHLSRADAQSHLFVPLRGRVAKLHGLSAPNCGGQRIEE